MEYNGITDEELKQLSDIDGFDQWERIDRYFPETSYVPDSDITKTGVVNLPLGKKEKPSEGLKLYTVRIKEKVFLLRTDFSERFSEEAELAAFAHRIFKEGGAYMTFPSEVGAYAHDTMVYSLYEFFCGDNLARRLPEFSTSHQLSFGVEAGELLKKIHSILPKPENTPAHHEDMFLILTKLEEKGIKYDGFNEAAAFMKKYHALPENRPVTAVHGSFSANSLFLDKDLNVGILPLERAKWDDPVTDLVSISDSYSIPFMKGIFKGLYEGRLPKDFFELLCFYSTYRALSDIDTADSGEELDLALLRAKKLSDNYEKYQSVIPIWY